MSREKIREGIARRLRPYKLNEVEGHEPDCIVPWDECDTFTKEHWLRDADDWLTYLHSQGLVIKVDRELPKNPNKALGIDIDKNPKKTWDVAHSYGWRDGWACGRDDTIEAGYVAVEPLIVKLWR